MTEEEEADVFWTQKVVQTLIGLHSSKNPLIFDRFDADNVEVPTPEDTKFIEWSLGELKGESKTDWRASLVGLESGFHAVQYTDRYECHIDKFDPSKNLYKHLSEDSPGTLGWVFAAIAAISATISAYYFYKQLKKSEEE